MAESGSARLALPLGRIAAVRGSVYSFLALGGVRVPLTSTVGPAGAGERDLEGLDWRPGSKATGRDDGLSEFGGLGGGVSVGTMKLLLRQVIGPVALALANLAEGAGRRRR